LPDLDCTDVPYRGEQSHTPRHGFLIIPRFTRLHTVDVVREVEEQVVVRGHTLGMPRVALRFPLGSTREDAHAEKPKKRDPNPRLIAEEEEIIGFQALR
jgi:hypothetical protein